MSMIKKISIALFIPCLILAVFLAVNNVHHVELSNDFYSFMKRVAMASYEFDFSIPNIPQIPMNTTAVLGLQEFINFWVGFVNTLSSIINGLIYFLNTIIDVLKFFIIIIENWKEFESALLSGMS